MKIAMWSGPRNLSTALMYSFANRADVTAVDEPFYAIYLAKTGFDHPMRDAVIASQSTDPEVVVADLLQSKETPHSYQKHMTQHMVSGISCDWMKGATNVFLIRHPSRVLASWANKYDALTLADIGFAQQLELFEYVKSLDQTPIVIDSADVRADPEAELRDLCDAIGLEWDPAMLSWPAGPKAFDGVWASHWYDAVHRSTGFSGGEGDLPVLNGELAALNEKALPIYEELAAHKLAI